MITCWLVPALFWGVQGLYLGVLSFTSCPDLVADQVWKPWVKRHDRGPVMEPRLTC